MRRHADQTTLARIAALCHEAVQHQREREQRLGYGLDDYTEGRIVGAANLARKLLRVLNGEHLTGSGRAPFSGKPLAG
jgi:hypothetical protein